MLPAKWTKRETELTNQLLMKQNNEKIDSWFKQD